MFQPTNCGFIIKIKVIPKAARTALAGWEGDALRIRLAAVPEKGEANKELIRFLSKILNISPSKIEFMQGETSKHKKLCIKDINIEELENKLKES